MMIQNTAVGMQVVRKTTLQLSHSKQKGYPLTNFGALSLFAIWGPVRLVVEDEILNKTLTAPQTTVSCSQTRISSHYACTYLLRSFLHWRYCTPEIQRPLQLGSGGGHSTPAANFRCLNSGPHSVLFTQSYSLLNAISGHSTPAARAVEFPVRK